jgi:hypothetical protein
MFFWPPSLGGMLAMGVIGLTTAHTSSNCPTYDASKIKLVTFDCFAALMSWEGLVENQRFVS